MGFLDQLSALVILVDCLVGLAIVVGGNLLDLQIGGVGKLHFAFLFFTVRTLHRPIKGQGPLLLVQLGLHMDLDTTFAACLIAIHHSAVFRPLDFHAQFVLALLAVAVIG